MNKQNALIKFIPYFFGIYFVAGLFLFKDYGVSVDEGIQRLTIGLRTHNYIFHGDSREYLTGQNKYYGPALEALLFSLERALNLTDTYTIYMFRHLFIFLCFFSASVCFYLLLKKVFANSI